jgi:hypothetical protein
MFNSDSTKFCQNCGCEISIGVFIFKGKIYCCRDCFYNITWGSSETFDLEDDRKTNTATHHNKVNDQP